MTDLGFEGRTAIVTGAGGGLGKEYALLLASRGARVVVNDIGGSITGEGTDDHPAEAVAREIRDQGGDAVADTHSVATPEGGQALVQAALDAYGRVDIVVNNAGILRDRLFEELTPDQLEPVLDVHLKGAFFVIGPAWAAMRSQGYGRVVNTTSAAGILGGSPGKSNYGAAKTGLIGLTRMLTQSLAKADQGGDRPGRPAADVATEQRLRSLIGRFDPALVAPVMAFLAHEDCPVSGEIYTAGAGQVARFFIGRTRGYYNPALSVEDVRDHLTEIRDEADYTVPADAGAEIAQLFHALATWPAEERA
jgi:NAD(P)-dependent dehydrogenase (short-subunit alcohol dehydrogenase family)